MTDVLSRSNRQTGTTVVLIDNRDDSFDWGGGPWVTLCEDHGNYCEHESRKLAERFLPVPAEWCEDCGDTRCTVPTP